MRRVIRRLFDELEFCIVAFVLAAVALGAPPASFSAEAATAAKLANLTWVDPKEAAADDPDFLLQGEYAPGGEDSAWAVQVVAMGGGNFDAYLLEGGLPGAGWNRKLQRIKLSGKRESEAVAFASTEYPIRVLIHDQLAQVFREGKQLAELRRVERQSPTLGAKPPAGAVVLFDGRSADAWINGCVENGLLANNDITSKQEFADYLLHLEFRTPYKPYARGQQRGNSGIYHQGRYETQVLDSFGLEGGANEAGGIYSIAAPMTNACLPPLVWQTYDVDFTAAQFDDAGEPIDHARITVRLNGILVHNQQELPHTTTAAPNKSITDDPGPFFIQHHRNPVFYRNIWAAPK